jgi:anthranilate synthase component 1
VVFLGYEIAAEIEPHLTLPPTPLPWTAFALRTPCALVHVLESDTVWAVAEPGAEGLLDAVVADARRVHSAGAASGRIDPAYQVREEDPARYIERVLRAQEYIRAGDIYQANLSRPWHVQPTATAGSAAHAQALDPALLYERLRARNPAPFAALVQWDGVSILSSSPERLLRVSGREVDTRPIAGTRPRTLRPGEDAPEAAALVAHPKERAEHIMLIDLERNDLGRVCEAGTVIVNELMVTETYAHVHHIVSNVQGRLRSGVTPIGALRAVFPGGTITGCPKFRCMQIIAELEGQGRGAFYGSLGYLTPGGEMDLNILIRTMTLEHSQITLRTGGGIVADSDPERELNETRAKARGMLAVFE